MDMLVDMLAVMLADSPMVPPGGVLDSIMLFSSLILAVKRLTTQLICSISDPCDALVPPTPPQDTVSPREDWLMYDATPLITWSSVPVLLPKAPATALWLTVLIGDGVWGRYVIG